MNLQDGALTAQQMIVLAPLGLVFVLFFLGGLVADLWLLVNLRTLAPLWRRQADLVRTRPWTWPDAAALTLAALLMGQLVLLLTSIQEHALGPGTDNVRLTLLLHTAWVPAGLMGLIFCLLRNRGITWRQAFGIEGQSFRRSLRVAAFTLLALFPLLVVCASLAQVVLKKLGFTIESQDAVKFLTDSANPLGFRIYLAVAAAGVAPIIEEITFRGVILPAVARHARLWIAIMSVSIVFSAIHFNAQSFVPLVLLAISLSMSYIYSGTIITAVLIHATFNCMSMAVLIATKLAGI
jgi:uncharacterized protein